jgi:hypothetical protein
LEQHQAYNKDVQTPKVGTPEVGPDFVQYPGAPPKWAAPLSAGAQAALDEAKELFFAHLAAVPLEGLSPIRWLLELEGGKKYAGRDMTEVYAESTHKGGYVLGLIWLQAVSEGNNKHPAYHVVVQECYNDGVFKGEGELVSYHLTVNAFRQASKRVSVQHA